jgi:hypothetical protein
MPPASTRSLALAVVLSAVSCRDAPVPRDPLSPAVRTRLARLPSTTAIVVDVDVARARTTALWRTYGAAIEATFAPGLRDALAPCGLDPIAHVDRVLLSFGRDAAAPRDAAATLEGRFTEADVARCAPLLGPAGGTGESAAIEVTRQGRLTIYRDPGAPARTAYAAWLGPHTIALVPSALDDAAAARALAEGTGVDRVPELVDLVARTDTAAVVWAAGAIPPPVRARLASIGYVPDGFFLAIDAAADVSLRLGLRYADERAAASSARLATGWLEEARARPPLPFLKEVLATARLERSGRVVVGSARLTTAQLGEIATMIRAAGGAGP